MLQIAVIPGDGIGPEVMAQALPVLEWAQSRGLRLAWDVFPFGADRFLATGHTLLDEEFEYLQSGYDAILFGAIGDPRVPDGRHAEEILLRLRRDLRLSVNLRPCFPMLDRIVPLKGVAAREIRIEVMRENTEGPYCLKGETRSGEAVDFAIHTEAAVETLLREAFERAAARNCPLHLAHKANVLKHGHGLWMRVFERLRLQFPGVTAQAIHADALLCALVRDPRPFGVIAADNFIGDLVSDLLAAFQGGLGLAASASYSPRPIQRCLALYEPVHGSAPGLAGLDRANPLGMILSVGLLFQRAGWEAEARAIDSAIRSILEGGQATEELGGTQTCSKMGQAVLDRLSRLP
jgi:3-isopropylmalate dehydrogenase